MINQAHLKIKHLLSSISELMWHFFLNNERIMHILQYNAEYGSLKPYDGVVAEDVLQT